MPPTGEKAKIESIYLKDVFVVLDHQNGQFSFPNQDKDDRVWRLTFTEPLDADSEKPKETPRQITDQYINSKIFERTLEKFKNNPSDPDNQSFYTVINGGSTRYIYQWSFSFDADNNINIQGSDHTKYFIDSQTDLGNSRYLPLIIERIHAVKDDLGEVIIIFADLNNLKRANTLGGYETGDQLIKDMGAAFRETDYQLLQTPPTSGFNGVDSARYRRGDEFIKFILIGKSGERIEDQEIINLVEDRIDAFNQDKDPNQIPLSACFGVAIHKFDDPNSKLTDSITLASQNMRANKRLFHQEDPTKADSAKDFSI